VHEKQTSMPQTRFKPTIPASERPQTHAIDQTATGIDIVQVLRPVKTETT